MEVILNAQRKFCRLFFSIHRISLGIWHIMFEDEVLKKDDLGPLQNLKSTQSCRYVMYMRERNDMESKSWKLHNSHEKKASLGQKKERWKERSEPSMMKGKGENLKTKPWEISTFQNYLSTICPYLRHGNPNICCCISWLIILQAINIFRLTSKFAKKLATIVFLQTVNHRISVIAPQEKCSK